MMNAYVSDTISFDSSSCPPKVLEKLRHDLSFPNPEYVSRLRMGRSVFGIYGRIECMKEHRDGWVELPRGADAILKHRFSEAGISLTYEDQRCVHPALGLKADVQLRGYQCEAVERMKRGVQGVVVMPCGGGKTVTATAAIAAIDQPTLVIVHTNALVEQWCATIRRILGIEPGIVANGTYTPSIVTVATVQTLVRLPIDELYNLSRYFGCVIVDEAHHTPSSTFQSVLGHMPARYRFGLTATPQREDGLTLLLDFTIGKRLFEITYAELVSAGYLNRPEVQPVYSSFSFNYSGPDDQNACMSALIKDTDRNNLVAELAYNEATSGHSVLVLSGRLEHCRCLAQMLIERGIQAEALVGSVKKVARQRILNDFRDGRLSVVIASTLADEGLDIPRLDRVILAYPGRAKGRTAQRIGRLMRPHPEKKDAVLFDIVDSSMPLLLRQYNERRRIYEELSC